MAVGSEAAKKYKSSPVKLPGGCLRARFVCGTEWLLEVQTGDLVIEWLLCLEVASVTSCCFVASYPLLLGNHTVIIFLA